MFQAKTIMRHFSETVAANAGSAAIWQKQWNTEENADAPFVGKTWQEYGNDVRAGDFPPLFDIHNFKYSQPRGLSLLLDFGLIKQSTSWVATPSNMQFLFLPPFLPEGSPLGSTHRSIF